MSDLSLSPRRELPVGIQELGDSGLLVTLGHELSVSIAASVWRLEALLQTDAIYGVTNLIPAPSSLLVMFDCELIDVDELGARLDALRSSVPATTTWEPPNTWRVACCYGGGRGPDLDEVAEQLGFSADDLIEEHSAESQVVLANGFAPGFCYVGLLPERWDIPRRAEVKSAVPSGSISVAVRQTVLSATPGPTGWSTIAQTPFVNLDRLGERPVKIVAGDEIRFEPVSETEFIRLARGLHE